MSNLAKLVCFFLLTACVTTTDIETFAQRKPLAKETPVEVFYDTKPTFGYDVICKAKVQVTGNFVATEVAKYSDKAREVARDCGTQLALIESLNEHQDNGKKVIVVIKAIEKTTAPSAIAKILLEDKAYLKKLGTAAGLGNIKNLAQLLTAAGVSKTSRGRAPLDSETLSRVMIAVASNGATCAEESLQFLATEYDAVIETLTVDDFLPSKVLQCPSVHISKNFKNFKNKTKEVMVIYDVVVKLLNVKSASAGDKNIYKNYLKMYPEIMQEVDSRCAQEETSQLCSVKPNLTQAKATIDNQIDL